MISFFYEYTFPLLYHFKIKPQKSFYADSILYLLVENKPLSNQNLEYQVS